MDDHTVSVDGRLFAAYFASSTERRRRSWEMEMFLFSVCKNWVWVFERKQKIESAMQITGRSQRLDNPPVYGALESCDGQKTL
eukprot:scaffold22642_cov134-Cylindrotheca_fusiformis.AAC.15